MKWQQNIVLKKTFTKLIEALITRDKRYKEIGAGKTLQTHVSEFFNNNESFFLLKFSKGIDDEGHGGLQQNVELTCNDLAGEKIDEVLKYIKIIHKKTVKTSLKPTMMSLKIG